MEMNGVVALESQFDEVKTIMEDVRSRKFDYASIDNRLVIFINKNVLIVESVADMLMHSAMSIVNWQQMQKLIREYDIELESLVCFANANNWGISLEPRHSVGSVYALMARDYLPLINVEEEWIGVPVTAKSSMRQEATIFSDFIYVLVNNMDYNDKQDCPVTICGVFTNMKSLLRAYKGLNEQLAKCDERISTANHNFYIHALVPNRFLGAGVEVAISYLESEI